MEISLEQEPAKGGWKSSIYIIGVEVAERFAFYGIAGNLITYLTKVLHESIAKAAKNVNIWLGVSAILPLLGAFIADAYVGRFKIILFASLIYILGLVMLTLSVSVIPSRFRKTSFFLSLYLVAIGEGGHKPCVQTFGADQFDEDKAEEKKAKSSFFNWWYFGICGGASSAMLLVYYVQDYVGWQAGFGISAIAMGVALILFLLGRKLYRQEILRGSPLTRIVQVFIAASRKQHLVGVNDGNPNSCEEGEDPMPRILPQTKEFKCLNKAAIVDEIDASSVTKNNWRLCSTTQVEEAKLVLRLVPIWLSCLMYAVVFAQVSTFFTKQGSTMDRKITHDFHVPAASLQVVTGFVVMLIIPVYDRVIVPFIRKFTGFQSGIAMLQRIGIGIFISIIVMVVAALVESRRVRVARDHGLLDQPNTTLPMRIWWLLPQYVIIGIADVFTIVGLQELFYSQMPDGMRSIGSAVYLSVLGVGSFLSSAIISIVESASSRYGDEWLGNNLNKAHLDDYYWVLAGLSTLWLGLFVVLSKSYVYKS
ncbi:hypothetical protein GIB67_025131 [Kingdonia uniflora]|uniref:NPF family transporter n=1 Tax=Kingdonia uniflora TaxID=39325 RepID=A0A7J7N809_9MAGN|nr:hypothetical protein GIB67_025131 [Kingdonia uniflora]